MLFSYPSPLEPGALKIAAQDETVATAAVSEDEIDAALERAAHAALGEREGTIIVMNPQNGRLRAVVNQRLAFGQAFPPGSTIKPFTALSALQAGVINGDSRLACHDRYTHEGFSIACSHPKINAPFDPAQALAFSCNYYFGKLGERLSEGAFDATLDSFGFGARTGGGVEPEESAGKLPGKGWQTSNALGEGEQLLVTPMQLIAAYTALVNGGRLYTPQRAAASKDFVTRERSSLSISPVHREVLLEGMRGAVSYGTAMRSELDSLTFDIFGKTGTSTEVKGFRTQGWFVGFAASRSPAETTPPPDEVRLAVLVFVKRTHGAECALMARPIFEEFARLASTVRKSGDAQTERQGTEETIVTSSEETIAASPSSLQSAASPASIKVHMVRENRTITLSLADYLLGVVATEGSTEDELESLKALAVASRTFVLKNIERHASEGYNFCTTTHCQRYTPVADGRETARASAAFRRAVSETEGEVLRDERGQIVEAYFSAACGGRTANVATLWGGDAQSYLRGVRDDYCTTMPHRSWTDVIPATELARALHNDSRSDTGARLDNVIITRRDATGRAETIALEGETIRTLRGWDFKLIVGRTLGWHVLKSSRFEVRRAGPNFIFRGSGFGHGLGLCQEGAHVMARRGASYRQILNHYFPGTSIGNDAMDIEDARQRVDGNEQKTEDNRETVQQSASYLRPTADRFLSHAAPSPQKSRLSLSSENFRVSYPARVAQREVEIVLGTLEAARVDVMRRLSAASLGFNAPAMLDVIIHDTTGDFTGTTGQPHWAAAVTRATRIELQPLDVLRRRGVLATTLRHEYVHAVIEALGHGRTPRWLAEGLAIHVAGEGAMLSRFQTKTGITSDELEQRLARPASAPAMRALYAAAYREVQALIRSRGESLVWRQAVFGHS